MIFGVAHEWQCQAMLAVPNELKESAFVSDFDFSNSDIDADQLLQLLNIEDRKVEYVDYLALYQCKNISDAVIPIIARMPLLEYLCLGFTQVTGSGLAKLPVFEELHTVSIEGLKGMAYLIDYLCSLPRLKGLELSFTDISANDVEKLLVHSGIDYLTIAGCGIGINDLSHLDVEVNDFDRESCKFVGVWLDVTPGSCHCIVVRKGKQASRNK